MKKKFLSTSLSFLFCLTVCCSQNSEKLLQRIFYQKSDTAWAIIMKQTYSYDKQSDLKLSVSVRNDNGNWVNNLKTEYLKPPEGSDISRIEIVYEAKNNSWVEPNRSSFIKDEKGNEKSEIIESYDSANEHWVIRVKGEFLNNTNGSQSEKTYAKPDSTGGWKNEDRILFSYNDSGLLTEENHQTWGDNKWMNYQKIIYHYNNKNIAAYTETFNADKVSNQFKRAPDSRDNFTYDNQGNLVERMTQKFINGKWEDKFRRVSIWGKS